MSRVRAKSVRMLQIEQFLLGQREPIAQAEIARRFAVNRSTITRTVRDMADCGVPIYEDEKGRIGINREAYLTDIRLNLDESMSLYLAARLLARYSDKPNPHTVEALLKLGLALEQGVAPQIGRHVTRTSQAIRDRSVRVQLNYVKTLETLTRAWAQGTKVRMIYRPLESKRGFEHTFAPYFLEPSAIGYATYAIGLAEPPGQIRTRKVERIESISWTGDTFHVPSDFDPAALLAGAWGIWFDAEDEPTPVLLRFSRDVARRVRESRWHPSEKVTEETGGDLVWRAEIDDIQEIIPWVRGWGADCEVLEPPELRQKLERDARLLARVYGVGSPAPAPIQERVMRCWGKTTSSSSEFHPAIAHMLDVGLIARELLADQAAFRWRSVLGKALSADPAMLSAWLPWIVALHDIGKISAAFQGLNEEQKQRLKVEGFSFGQWNHDIHHTILGGAVIQHELASANAVRLPERFHEVWIESVMGHHGRFLARDALQHAKAQLKASEPTEWRELRASGFQLLKEQLLKQAPDPLPEPENISAAIAALTGFTILCDWLGSDSSTFSSESGVDLAAYSETSLQRTRRLLLTTAFLDHTASLMPGTFTELFPDLRPRPLQTAIDSIPDSIISKPCLAIIEAPTGEGKTEAALALAHRIARLSGTDELYYALPTTATSNQMFGRLQKHLRDGLGLVTAVKLVHAQAFLFKDDWAIQPSEGADKGDEQAALEWFGPKKRALLAPFGVGTVDQAELAALNAKHVCLRLIGLAGKVVIIDEVHAYDTYMTTIIERLMQWLAVMGTSVILLSATLPQNRCKALAKAYGVKLEAAESAYPSIWVVNEDTCFRATPPADQAERRIAVEYSHWTDEQVIEKAQWFVSEVAQGGCVCWITNTVERAQRLFLAVDERVPADVDRLLLHARFPLEEREDRERELTSKYGPRGTRPPRGIVIGTQVLEQSLDIDFDLLVTDLAPIDLVLQRAGRLHRHTRPRPTEHARPVLVINAPSDACGEYRPGTDARIYAEYFLRRTWQTLGGRAEICLPADYRPLVEAVYSDDEPEPGSSLAKAWDKLQDQEEHAIQEARLRLLPKPGGDDPFCASITHNQFEEDETSAAWVVAQTRLGEETVNVIPLERADEQARLWPNGAWMDMDAAPPRTVQLQMLRQSLRVSAFDAVTALREQARELPRLFTESPLLKGYIPLWLSGSRAQLSVAKGRLTLILDSKLGLVIQREKRGEE